MDVTFRSIIESNIYSTKTMSNILQYTSANKALNDIKRSLESVGCDICDVESLTDVSKVIKDQLVTGPNAVINASLVSGPGIKISPVDRKGYKISANDTAVLSQDISSDLPKGMSVHKALFDIVHKIIPAAALEAAYAPSVLDVAFVKVPYDGCDYYPLQGQHGNGRKAGLRPNTWYTRITLNSQAEPMYVDMGNVIAEMRDELLCEALHMVDARIAKALGRDPQPQPQPDTKTTYPKEGAMWCPIDGYCGTCGKAKDECECDLCQKDRAKDRNTIQDLLGRCDCDCDKVKPQPQPAPTPQPQPKPSTDLENLISKLNGE